MPDVITSTDVAFRPIDVKMGPDGAIYIADWYNPIINHGEVDFRDPRRDKTHGRIWRLTAKGRPLVEKPKLVGVPVGEVLEQLKSPGGVDAASSQARVAIAGREGGASRAERVGHEARSARSANDEQQRLEALWAYQTLDTPEPKLLRRTVADRKTPQVRAAATRVVPDWANRLPGCDGSAGAAGRR